MLISTEVRILEKYLKSLSEFKYSVLRKPQEYICAYGIGFSLFYVERFC